MSWWFAAALCAFFIKGLCGFANTLIFSTIVSFQEYNINISPVELLLGYPTNLIMAWKERRSVKWRVCIPLSLLVLMGNIPGIFLLKNADVQAVKMIFGFVITAIGVEMLFRETNRKGLKGSKRLLGFIGILSGVLCGLYGIGALLAAYVSRVTDDSRAFKANICIVFIVENTFRIAAYALLGIISADMIRQALVLIPPMLLGLFAGMVSSKFLDEKIVKRLVIVMLILSGMALVVNTI